MVRFIIIAGNQKEQLKNIFTFQYGQIYYLRVYVFYSVKFDIYIPIWLDLLLYYFIYANNIAQNLHSNMVRFIIAKSTG